MSHAAVVLLGLLLLTDSNFLFARKFKVDRSVFISPVRQTHTWERNNA